MPHTRAGVADTRPGVSNLDVGVDDDIREAEDLAAEMEPVAEPRPLPLLVRVLGSASRVPGRSRSTTGEAYLQRKPETRTALPETDLGGERLDGFQVEVVIEVEVVEVLAVDQEVEHVLPLPAHLHENLRHCMHSRNSVNHTCSVP